MRYCSRILYVLTLVLAFLNRFAGSILYCNISSPFMSNIWYCRCLLQLIGDTELNPGPKPNSCKNVLIYHWNLNSIISHNFIKVSLLTTYTSNHKFDIIFLSEKYLNSEILSNDKSLNGPGYNLIRADHLSNKKRGGVCIYYWELLPLILYNVSYLKECICFEITMLNKLCNFISPSQSSDEFENFVYSLDSTVEALTQKNPSLTALIGDFNAKFNK